MCSRALSHLLQTYVTVVYSRALPHLLQTYVIVVHSRALPHLLQTYVIVVYSRALPHLLQTYVIVVYSRALPHLLQTYVIVVYSRALPHLLQTYVWQSLNENCGVALRRLRSELSQNRWANTHSIVCYKRAVSTCSPPTLFEPVSYTKKSSDLQPLVSCVTLVIAAIPRSRTFFLTSCTMLLSDSH